MRILKAFKQRPGWALAALALIVATPLWCDEGDVSLQSKFTFYGDNTEFFEPWRVRETLLGQQFRSYLDASTGDTTGVLAGLFADHRSAQDAPTNVQPILSFVYQTPNSMGVLGTLFPLYRHGLIEPMEVTTLEITRPIEYGFQWVQKDNFIHADLFLDWQDLLAPGQSEVFDYGGSAILPLNGMTALEGQLHGYHAGGVLYDVPVWNNLDAGVGLKLRNDPVGVGGTYLEVYGLGSKTTDLAGYPGPAFGYGLYTKIGFTPDGQWDFFGISWLGKDYFSQEGDSNYNSVGSDGTYYKSSRSYEEIGLQRFVTIESDVTFDFELRFHWIESSWANSFRLMAQVPLDVFLGHIGPPKP